MRTTVFFALSALLGASAVLWIGLTFPPGQPLGTAVVAVIGLAFVLGLVELSGYRRETAALAQAVARADADTDPQAWLAALPASLQPAVRHRVEGTAAGLPTPVLTPYLVGLLVLLGLLGTFVGMVDTLRGAVQALQGSTDLAAIRSGLAAPIAGLSIAFGTSVAGIAASAALGLSATLSRRERVGVSRALDILASGIWRSHTLGYQRQEAYRALREQSALLPALVARLDTLASSIERGSDDLSTRLQAQQGAFLEANSERLAALTASVDASLKESLSASAEASARATLPLVETALAGLAAEAESTRRELTEAQTSQVQAGSAAVAALAETVRTQLAALTEHTRTQLASLQASTATEIAQLGAALQAPLGEVMAAAAAAPRAAAEAVAEVREASEAARERDEALFAERRHILEDLSALSAALETSVRSQQAALSELVAASADRFTEIAGRFDASVSAQADRLAEAATDTAASSADLACLGDAFGHGVELYSTSSRELATTLAGIQQALEQATQRSDEQMAYYVAQAREIIDQSLLSQRELIDGLRGDAAPVERAAAEVG